MTGISGEAGVLIVGAGQGGFQAAASLRQLGYAGPVRLLGEEPGLPYQRPPLSKAYLKDGDAGRLALRPAAFYATSGIERAEGRAVAIDRAARAVDLADGRRLPYGHLILAPGARNIRPPLPGIDRPGVHFLRTLADAAALRAALPASRHVIVIGGGFIGLEFAAVARAAGRAVTVIEAADRLMARVVSPETSARVLALHRGLGVQVALSRPAARILPDGVALADGAEIRGDLVLIAVGVRPNVELAAAAGLAIDNGVAADARLLTSDPAISALGDACAFPDPRTGARIRLESVQAATDQARAIAARLTGAPADYAAVPWFWSDQADWKLQIAGLAPRHADTTAARDLDRGGFAIQRFEGEALVCVETVNAPAEHMAARKLLARPVPVTRAEIAAAGGLLAPLLRAAQALA